MTPGSHKKNHSGGKASLADIFFQKLFSIRQTTARPPAGRQTARSCHLATSRRQIWPPGHPSGQTWSDLLRRRKPRDFDHFSRVLDPPDHLQRPCQEARSGLLEQVLGPVQTPVFTCFWPFSRVLATLATRPPDDVTWRDFQDFHEILRNFMSATCCNMCVT